LSNKTRLHLLKKTTKENVLSYTGSAYSLFIRLGKNKYYAKKGRREGQAAKSERHLSCGHV
jgi:hypothetical protein